MSSPRRLSAAGLLIGSLLAVQLTMATSAAAHDELVSSLPADGATLTALPAAVRLVFAEPPIAGFTTMTVCGPDGRQLDSGAPRVNGARISEFITATNELGRYSIKYRIMSDDGHAVSGVLHFTLAAGAVPAARAAASAESAVGGAPQRRSGWPAPLASVAAGVVLLVIVLAGATMRAGRVRSRAPAR